MRYKNCRLFEAVRAGAKKTRRHEGGLAAAV